MNDLPREIGIAPAPHAVIKVLRFVVSWMCLGAAVDAWKGRASAYPLVWVHELLAQVTDGRVEVGGGVSAAALLMLAVLIAVRPRAILLYLVALWFLVVMAYKTANAPIFAAMTPLSQAVRYVAPVALAIVMFPAGGRLTAKQAIIFEWMLRLAAAATFIGHGYKVFMLHGQYVPLITETAGRVGVTVPGDVVHAMMRTIGAIDILVAGLLLGFRFRIVAAYMAVWGFATAFSRVTAYGFDFAHEFLIRLANGGVPLTLLLWWHLHGGVARDAATMDDAAADVDQFADERAET